jgi:sugar lactone lactonase YvrE
MKTYLLKPFTFAAAILLAASWAGAQGPGSLDQNLSGAGAVSPVVHRESAEIGDLTSSAPSAGGYLWTTFFADDRPKTPLTGIAVTAAGDVYATKGCAIVRIASDGKLTTVAGVADSSGSADGVGSEARFNAPNALTLDARENLYVSDQKNHTIRKITPAAEVTTLAGSPGLAGSANGAGGEARFYHPAGLGLDSLGNLFVCDVCNHTIRRITAAGTVSTLADPLPPTPATSEKPDATVGMPGALAVDGGGNIYYVPRTRRSIRKVTPNGTVSTVAGVADEVSEAVDGPGGLARFQRLTALAVDPQGNIYVIDLGAIRKMSLDGIVRTISRNSGAPGREADVQHSVARLDRPLALAASKTGVVYVTCSDGIIRGTPIR